jgi:hypothetical protein
MTNKEVILKAVKFIEGNLKEEIDVSRFHARCAIRFTISSGSFQSITGFFAKELHPTAQATEGGVRVAQFR